MYRFLLLLPVFVLICLFTFSRSVQATDIPWGVHLLHPQELPLVIPYRGDAERFYVTVPMSVTERDEALWNSFFELSFKSGITPIIRLVTDFSNGAWTVPDRKDVVETTMFLRKLHWAGSRYVVLFNEPNHAPEWGGHISPEDYVEIAHFAASWLKTEPYSYVVLPAGLDAAASNTSVTMDSFRFIDRMYKHDPEFFQVIDGWTSHAYPNPGFSSSPYVRDKDSVWGFQMELKRLKNLTGRDYDVYVTETGWKMSPALKRSMPKYYSYTVKNVWNNKSIKAVTLFVFRGFNGPFADFSLLDANNNPTLQFEALLNAVKS